MKTKKFFFISSFIAVVVALIGLQLSTSNTHLPLIAIANYGPHSSLEATITGVKEELARGGFIEGKTVRYAVADVGFDIALIPQMLVQLKRQQPKLMVVLATPLAQCAKGMITDIPLVFAAVTDPVAAGLLTSPVASCGNVTGSAEKQDMAAVLDFARALLPGTQRVGVLYGTGESNDCALVEMMQEAAQAAGMKVLAVPVDQARDVPVRMQQLKNKIDVLYVGSSGPIQPALPIIAGIADELGIPVINVDEAAVRDGLVLASFGVDFNRVGANAGKLAAQILEGTSVVALPPLYPTLHDHRGLINRRRAAMLGLTVPHEFNAVTLVG